MRTRTTAQKTPAPPPRPQPPRVHPALRDDPSTTEQSHAGHFLQRVLRCEGADLDRAMRLYHHPSVMRDMVPELMDNLYPGHDRAAIPLRTEEPSPHVIITRSGSFVTCLAPHMSIAGLPVLPYSALEHQIGQVELHNGRARRLGTIYQALSPAALLQGVLDGPGALTYERVAVFEKDPWAYEVCLWKAFVTLYNQHAESSKLQFKFGPQPRLRVMQEQSDMQLKQLALLIGALDGPMSAQMEPLIVDRYLRVGWEFAAAVARKPGRAKILMKGLSPQGDFPEFTIAFALEGLLHHCLWFPEEAAWIHPILASYQLPAKAPPCWFSSWATPERRAWTPSEAVAWARDPSGLNIAQRLRETLQDIPIPPMTVSRHLDFHPNELMTMATMRAPVASYFPLQRMAQRYSQGWAEHLRKLPKTPPPRFGGPPIKHTAPRITPNQPCPCHSGRKYKRCCGGGHAPPP